MKRNGSPAYDAVVAGYLGIDLAPRFPADAPGRSARDLIRPGKLVETAGLTVSLGGVVANTGLAMRHFGRRVALMGSVGTDALGMTVKGLLRAQGADCWIREVPDDGTAHGIVLAPPGLDRIFFEDPGCNGRFSSADIDYDIVRRCRLFHFGYPPLMRRLWTDDGLELRRMFARVRRLGTATSLDMALPDPASPAGRADWRAVLANVLPFVDIFMPSVEELLFMLEPREYARLLHRARGGDLSRLISDRSVARLADQVMAAGVQVLMIKSGERGAFLRTSDVSQLGVALGASFSASNWSHRSLWSPAYRADPRRIRNSSGAGDCAVAGFLSALLTGVSIERAARYAMLAGRDNLYGFDACSGLQNWTSMTRTVQRASSRSFQEPCP